MKITIVLKRFNHLPYLSLIYYLYKDININMMLSNGFINQKI